MDPITLTLVGLLALALSCSGSKEEILEPQSDSNLNPRDAGPSKKIGDASPPRDAAVTADRYIAPDTGKTPDIGPDSSPDAGSPRILTPDVNINPTSRLAIFAGDFSQASGLLTGLNLETLALDSDPSSIASTDVILRSNETNLFAIDRWNAAIGIYGNDLNNLNTFLVDVGTNPQDIALLPGGEKAYVTRLDAQDGTTDTDDLWIFTLSPVTGTAALSGSVDLSSCTADDGDQLSRAAQMVLVGARLYIVVQDLSSFYSADTNGKVAVVDTRTDALTACIPLTGWNPADITYSGPLNKVFVTNTGPYNDDFTISLDTAYGGIETIDPETNSSQGIQTDDLDLEGAVSEIRLASADLGYVITDFRKIASFNPSTGAVVDTAVYTSPGYFLPDFTISASGALIIAEQGSGAPGEAGIKIPPADPIDVDAPPSSLAFIAEE